MTDPAVKIASAFCVILAGICASMLFRHNPADVTDASSEPVAAAAAPAAEPQKSAPAAIVSDAKVAPKPQDDQNTLRPIHPSFEATTVSETMNCLRDNRPLHRPAAAVENGVRRHRIVDGDSLESLAERYLGFSARSAEIFEANRNVLSDPEILPLGVEIKIPPADVQRPQPARP